MAGLAHRLAVNTLHNAAGRVWVIGTTLVLTAYAVGRLGADAFAIWSVVTAVSSYAGVFDLGAGSSFAKFVAEYRTRGDTAGISAVVSGGLVFYLAGALAVGAAALASEPLLARAFHLPPELVPVFRDVLRLAVLASRAERRQRLPGGRLRPAAGRCHAPDLGVDRRAPARDGGGALELGRAPDWRSRTDLCRAGRAGAPGRQRACAGRCA
jgi:hypothetical protein